MKLYEITGQIKYLVDKLDHCEDPAMYESIMQELASLDIARDEKIQNCCAYMKQLKAEKEVIDAEISKLLKKSDSKLAAIERIKSYLSILIDGQSWKNPLHSLFFKSTSSVICLDETQLAEYTTTEIVTKIDKQKIKEDLLSGKEVKGAELVHKTHLQLR